MEMEKRANQDKPVRPLSVCLYYQWLVILLIAFIVLTDIRNENNRNDDADDASQDSALIENERKGDNADDEAHNRVIALSERFQHEPGDKSDDERPYDTQNKSQNCSHDVFLSAPF